MDELQFSNIDETEGFVGAANLKRFIIPEEERELFAALTTSRERVDSLKAMLNEYEATEKKLAASVFSKHGIPPDQDISYREWMVFAVGGVELPAPLPSTAKERKKGKAKAKAAKKKAKKKKKKQSAR